MSVLHIIALLCQITGTHSTMYTADYGYVAKAQRMCQKELINCVAAKSAKAYSKILYEADLTDCIKESK